MFRTLNRRFKGIIALTFLSLSIYLTFNLLRQYHDTWSIVSCNRFIAPFDISIDKIPTFQEVNELELDLWVSSAYLDYRYGYKYGRVRIISVTSEIFEKDGIFCTIWYKNNKKVISMRAYYKSIWTYWPYQKRFFQHCSSI